MTPTHEMERERQVRFFFGSFFRFLAAFPIIAVAAGLGVVLFQFSLRSIALLVHQSSSAHPVSEMMHLPVAQLGWVLTPGLLGTACLALAVGYLFGLPERYRCVCQACHNPPTLFPHR